ncbi:hypothetical protein GIG_02137 [Mycoplasmopsis anatis 1340]|uniref:Uncharacterized protein n=1 Tax=Mycoplasmopsis anatis 1340 TaxID=1034808 RepID=F9QDC1_9BACT|nr:hypothetical protein GIG_02137 [Mycoplasmopsis anatis 1340]
MKIKKCNLAYFFYKKSMNIFYCEITLKNLKICIENYLFFTPNYFENL